MKNYIKMLNALDKVETISHDERVIKNNAMNVIFNHLHINNIKIAYNPKKGFNLPKSNKL